MQHFEQLDPRIGDGPRVVWMQYSEDLDEFALVPLGHMSLELYVNDTYYSVWVANRLIEEGDTEFPTEAKAAAIKTAIRIIGRTADWLHAAAAGVTPTGTEA